MPCTGQHHGDPAVRRVKHGNDGSVALHLAPLMRLGRLAEGCIYPCEQRGTRDLLCRRFSLVQQAVRLLLSNQSSFSRNAGKQPQARSA